MPRFSIAAGVLLTMAMSAIGQENKDPFLWLEDVTGDKALTWVKQQNAESTAELTKNDAFKKLDERLLKILDSKEKIPFIAKHGDLYYNFWRDAKHKRGLMAAHHARGIPQARAQVGNRPRPRRAGRAGKGKLGLARGQFPAARRRALPGLAVARRGRRRGRPRVRPEDEGVRQGRLHAARGQERCRLERPGHIFVGTNFGPGFADQFGLSADRQGMEARHAAGRCQVGLRGQAGRRGRERVEGPDPRLRTRVRPARGDVLDERDVPPPRRQAGQDRQARRRHRLPHREWL